MVLPAPDGPTSANVLPAGTVNVAPSSASRWLPKYENVTSRTSILDPARAGRSIIPRAERHHVRGRGARGARPGVHPRTVRDHLDRVMHRVERRVAPRVSASCLADMGDLRDREKRRHREQGEHGQNRRSSAPVPVRCAPVTTTTSPPSPVAASRIAVCLVRSEKTAAAARCDAGCGRRTPRRGSRRAGTRGSLRKPLDGVDGVGVHVSERLAGPRALHVDAMPTRNGLRATTARNGIRARAIAIRTTPGSR